MRSLLIFFALCLQTMVNAQTPDTTGARPQGLKPEATQRAAQQLKRLQKQLHLTEDQVLQLQVILINRDVAMDSIAHKPSVGPVTTPESGRASDLRRSNARARRQIQQDADQKINAILTDEQKPLYQQWKQQQKDKLMQRRQQNQTNGSVNNPVNNTPENNPR